MVSPHVEPVSFHRTGDGAIIAEALLPGLATELVALSPNVIAAAFGRSEWWRRKRRGDQCGRAASGRLGGRRTGEDLVDGGLNSNTVLGSGGYAEEDGFASGTLVKSGGQEDIFAGDDSISSIVQKGGVQEVFQGGEASGTVLGGTQIVSVNGLALSTSVEAGGVLSVVRFGEADNETISKGGIAAISGIGFGALISGG
jgi:autotransporter passenger strand-loop-strand repeat protein